MSNNKEMSIDWLIDRIKNQHLYPFVPLDELENKAKEMYKQEMINFTSDWHHNGLLSLGVLVSTSVEEHYNKTFKQ